MAYWKKKQFEAEFGALPKNTKAAKEKAKGGFTGINFNKVMNRLDDLLTNEFHTRESFEKKLSKLNDAEFDTACTYLMKRPHLINLR